MKQGSYGIEVLVNGRAVREYAHGGDTFVAGKKGAGYALRITNDSDKRVCAVVTVDGLSVLDGKESSHESGGYILPPFQSVTIPGWRLDNEAVAKFVFSSLPESYANRMGKPGAIGVIGCAVFSERAIPRIVIREIHHYPATSPRPYYPQPYHPPSTPSPRPYRGPAPVWCGIHPRSDVSASGPATPSAGDPRPEAPRVPHQTPVVQGIGTGFGSKTRHEVSSVEFEAESSPSAVLTLRYADRAGLKALGIDLKARVAQASQKACNPARGVGCKPPEGWEPE